MTPFAKKVYKVVLTIPLGETRSYKWVAEKAGRPGAARAVGQTLNRNPYPFIIPCHRVVKSNNESGGYAFGGRNKKLLLALEKKIKKCLEIRK
ncbi:MAG: MGMT family protein [Candidatus Omnitrophota bacterium]|jgi:methylated-DNA-[protein]-cysteine S-methyltransferase